MRGRFAAVLLGLALVAACSEPDSNVEEPLADSPVDPNAGYPPLDPPEARADALSEVGLEAGFEIEPYEPGPCRFDYRAQVARISPAGEVAWVTDVPWIGEREPLLVGSVLVARFDGERSGLFGLDIESGNPSWQRFFDDERIQDISSDGEFIALRTRLDGDTKAVEILEGRTGETAWRSEPGFGWTVELVEGIAVVDTEEGLAGLDDGAGVWEVPVDTIETMVHRHADLVVADHYPAVVTAHRPSDGSEVWRWRSDDEDTAAFLTAIIDGFIVLDLAFDYEQGGEPPSDGSDRGVVVLDAATGAEVWSRRAIEAEVIGSMLLVRDRGGRPSEVVRLRDGSVLWEPPGTVWPRVGAGELIAVIGEEIEDGSSGVPRSSVIHAGDSSTLWEPGEPGELATLAAFDDLVVAGTWTSSDSSVVTADPGGTLYGIDPGTGEQRWAVQLRDPFGHQPTRTTDGDFIITASDPPIFCD